MGGKILLIKLNSCILRSKISLKMKSALILIPILFSALAFGAKLKEIHVLVGPEDGGTNDRALGVTVTNNQNETCTVDRLNVESGSQFKVGEVDAFHDEEMGECLDFEVPNSEVSLIARHHGSNAVTFTWFRVLFDDGTYKICPDGGSLDNEDAHFLICP